MGWNYYPEYVTAAERKAKALKKVAALRKQGQIIEPLGELTHRTKIATSFWGRAWCRHLESFSDYENRLPRGRTYVRSGAVLHLAIEPGIIRAMVQGSELYKLEIRINPLNPKQWAEMKKRCQGGIGSLIELLQGRISDEIMGVVTDKKTGLFPAPKEIHLNCDCPDYADMCKHVAAVLYGVGARLDTIPALLFTLRGVDHNDLITTADAASTLGKRGKSARRRTLSSASITDVFGIDLEDVPSAEPTKTAKAPVKKSKPPATKMAKKKVAAKAVKTKTKTKPKRKAKPTAKAKSRAGA